MLEPYTVLTEVVAAIKRRTGSEILAERILHSLQEIDNIFFLELVAQRANRAAEIAKETGLRGMDAIVVQIAEEFKAVLVTLDEEVINKSGRLVIIRSVDEFYI